MAEVTLETNHVILKWRPILQVPVVIGVMGPLCEWPYRMGVITLIHGVATLLITGRTPPCRTHGTLVFTYSFTIQMNQIEVNKPYMDCMGNS